MTIAAADLLLWLVGCPCLIDTKRPDPPFDVQVNEYFEPLPSRELPDVSSLDPTLLADLTQNRMMQVTPDIGDWSLNRDRSEM